RSECDASGGRTAPVLIGDDVFIGAHAIILKGVRLGNRVVVGAGAVVTRSFDDDSVIGGNPARLLRGKAPAEADPHASPAGVAR
ncbi:MAG: DapH/DapD/GlmU-related protein, partial [Kiritimatiellia bacterium]